MTKHDWNLDDAESITEFFENRGIDSEDRRWNIQHCTSEDGEEFTALRLANGQKIKTGPKKGQPAFTFFCLSRQMEADGYELTKEFIKSHKGDLKLLEPIDGLKFGVAFLQKGDEIWED